MDESFTTKLDRFNKYKDLTDQILKKYAEGTLTDQDITALKNSDFNSTLVVVYILKEVKKFKRDSYNYNFLLDMLSLKNDPKIIVANYLQNKNLNFDILKLIISSYKDLSLSLFIYSISTLIYKICKKKSKRSFKLLKELFDTFELTKAAHKYCSIKISRILDQYKAPPYLRAYFKDKNLVIDTEKFASSDSCKIVNKANRKFSNHLVKPCYKQNLVDGPKCYENKCYPVLERLSFDNVYGNVVLIKINNKPYVVKWNREARHKQENVNEIVLQKIASESGIAPKILTVYDDKDHFYIIMDDLSSMGYKMVGSIRKNIDKVYEAINKALIKLHSINIVHTDLHPDNMFYNAKTDKAIFIDFGKAKLLNIENELENERFKKEDFDKITESYKYNKHYELKKEE